MRTGTAMSKIKEIKPADGHNSHSGASQNCEHADPEKTLRELSGRLIQLQDAERRRIARDLHDCMGQIAFLLTVNLHQIGQSGNLSPAATKLLADSLSLVDSMSTQVRTISYLLHPPLLDEVGLVPALRSMVEGFSQRSGIKTVLKIDDKFGRLPGDVEISIYRIVQECLSNIHRHSGSCTAQVRVERNSEYIELEVQDQGKGIPADRKTTGSGVGLGGMRERATQLGGTLKIDSHTKGTTVMARLPLSNKTAANAPRTHLDGTSIGLTASK